MTPPITEHQAMRLISFGYEAEAVAKLTQAQAQGIIKNLRLFGQKETKIANKKFLQMQNNAALKPTKKPPTAQEDIQTLLRERNLCRTKAERREWYQQYLRSAHWKAMRIKALDNYGHKCKRCSATKGIQVHHKTYERIGRERVTDLMLLCRACHALTHGNF